MTTLNKPQAGTFTFTAHWRGNVGVSDRLSVYCTGAEAHAAYIQAFERAGYLDGKQSPP
jgi:hypothetical protein